MPLLAPTERIVEVIHAERGILANAAKRLGCSYNDLLSAAASNQEIKDAIDDEERDTMALATEQYYRAIGSGEPWAVGKALEKKAQLAEDAVLAPPQPIINLEDNEEAHTFFIYDLLRSMTPYSMILEMFRGYFPSIRELDKNEARRVFNDRLSDATKMLAEDSETDIEVRRYMSAAVALDVIQDKEARRRDPNRHNANTLAALKHIAQLWGLYAPTKISPTTPDGKNPYEQLSVDELVSRILEKTEARSIGGAAQEA